MNLEEQLKNMTTDSLANQTMQSQIRTNHCSEDACPKCQNTGWIIIDDGGQGTAVECDCGIRKKTIHNSRLQFANIPGSFKDVRLDNFKKSVYRANESRDMIVDIAKAVRYWMQDFDNMKARGIGLYFYSGTKGSGKTRLAISIANELLDREIQVKFATSIQILEEISKTWKEKDVSESELIHALLSAEILVIDDFGAENIKGWINEKFYSIINGRYVDKKITIFTSNMSLDDLQYDERITNRIKERVLQIPFPEESVRDFIAEHLKNKLRQGVENK